MANILITGGSGLLGWRIVEQLLAQGHEVTIFDLVINHRNIGPFADRVAMTEGDINDLPLVLSSMKRHRIDHVVHLAAAIGQFSKLYPAVAFRTNIEGTANIFDCALALDVKRVVWASSAAVLQMGRSYDNHPLDEDYRLSSTDAYGISKMGCESLAHSYAENYDLDSIGIRPAITYGMGRMESATGLFNKMFQDMAFERPVQVMGTRTLHQPMYHKDKARLMILALFAPKPKHRIFNAPAHRNYTDDELVEALHRVKPHADISIVPAPDYMITVGVMDGARAEKELGFEPEYSVEDGAREMIELFRRQGE